MAKVEGLNRVIEAMRREVAKRGTLKVSGVVGYTQAYALWVHEDMEAKHKEGKQAKYLEGPFRSEAGMLANIVRKALLAGKTMGQAILLACLYLQRKSQQVVPIDTGVLKGSAFTRLEDHG